MSDYREKKNARLLMAIHGLQAEPNQQWEDRLMDALNHHTEFYVPMRTVGEGQERKPAFAVVEDKDHNHFYVLFTSQGTGNPCRFKLSPGSFHGFGRPQNLRLCD